jgi:DNA-binding transcriptional ArsR family regulator
MRSKAPKLLPVLRSRHQADILAELLLHPDREYTMTALATRLSIPPASLSNEVERLVDAGILAVRAVGRSRLVSVNATSRLVGPLTELIMLTFGPHVVVADEFTDLAGAELILIYGSWAARYNGERGRPPNDIDVLVVGAPDRMAMHAAAERAENRLGMPINPVVCSPGRWVAAEDPLIQEIQARPYVTILERDTSGD